MRKSTNVPMTPRAPGICGWCGKGTWGTTCPPCKGIEAHQRKTPGEQHALPEGRWVPVAGILVRVEGPELAPGGRAKCGTPGGYYSHLRHTRDNPCFDCRVAHTMAGMRAREDVAA